MNTNIKSFFNILTGTVVTLFVFSAFLSSAFAVVAPPSGAGSDGEQVSTQTPPPSDGGSAGEQASSQTPPPSGAGSDGEQVSTQTPPPSGSGSSGEPTGNGGTPGEGCVINCGGGGSSGGRGNTINDNDEIVAQISNVQITSVGSSVPTTTLYTGKAYTVSWISSTQNVGIALSLAPLSPGSNIPVGTSSNPVSVNKLNFFVPTSAELGNYFLYFTDSANRLTIAPKLYTILSKPTDLSAEFLGTGGGDLSSLDQSSATSGTGAGETSSEDEEEISNSSQTASAIGAGVWNKYLLWFFLLLLVVSGVLLARERNNITKKS